MQTSPGTKFGANQPRLLLETGASIQSTANTSRHLRSIIHHLLEVAGLGSGLQLTYANDSLEYVNDTLGQNCTPIQTDELCTFF